jgi:hypothetical protein
MREKYEPTNSFKLISAFLCILLVSGMGFYLYKDLSFYNLNDDLIAFASLLAWIPLSLFSAFGSKLYINDKQIEFSKYFFWKRKFNANDILGISYREVVGGKGAFIPTLFIYFFVKGKTKYIFLPSMHFSEKTLSKIASDVVRLKPALEIDPAAMDLLRKV